jgi:hypothetical protein
MADGLNGSATTSALAVEVWSGATPMPSPGAEGEELRRALWPLLHPLLGSALNGVS